MKSNFLRFVMVIPFFFFAAICSQAQQEVGQWDRFEVSLLNAEDYNDPYTDVALEVTYTKPDGNKVDFWGFFDGEQIWKIRFMPDQLGTWRYEAEFSDGSEKTSGNFECVKSDIPGMLSLDETNPMWFGFKGGNHDMIRCFHIGDRFFAENWEDEKRTAFLNWAEKQEYNMFSIASHYLNRESEGRGKGWDTPDLWPLNADEWQKMETILNELAERKIMVYPFAGFFGRDSDYPNEENKQEQYIRYTLARIGPYWNLLFNVAGPEPDLPKHPFLGRENVNRLGKLIKKLDVFGHPISVHNPTGDDKYLDEEWPDYSILQGPKTKNREKLSKGLLRNHRPNGSLYAQETLWPGNKYHPDYSKEDIRKNMIVIMLSAAALNYADMDGNSSSGFSGSMELSERHQEWHDLANDIWDFFESLPFYRMSPRQDLVSDGFCLAEEGQHYLVYLEEPNPVDVHIKPGTYRERWIRATDFEAVQEIQTNNGKDLTPPDQESDWLVYLTRE